MSRTEHKITRIEPVKRPRGYRAVYVDGDLALTAHRRVIESVGLRAGESIGPGRLQQALVAAREQEALRRALRFLATRDRTEQELRRDLSRRGFAQPTIATVLDRLRSKGLLDDRRFAGEYVGTQSRRRGLGPAALRAKLMQLGVAASVVNEALASTMSEDRQLDLARTVAEKRLPRLQRGAGLQRRSQLYRLLVQRGFDDEVAASVVEEFLGGE